MKTEICNRLKEIRLILKYNQKSFAARLNLDPGQLSSIELGKLNVTIGMMEKLSNEFKINLNWLITGQGNMFYENDEKVDIDYIINKLVEYKKQI